jgi:hypothetical protein
MDHKEARLLRDPPTCSVERVGLDLAERNARRELLGRIGATATRALALTEGVIAYLSVDEAGDLADDLRAQPVLESWHPPAVRDPPVLGRLGESDHRNGSSARLVG